MSLQPSSLKCFRCADGCFNNLGIIRNLIWPEKTTCCKIYTIPQKCGRYAYVFLPFAVPAKRKKKSEIHPESRICGWLILHYSNTKGTEKQNGEMIVMIKMSITSK